MEKIKIGKIVNAVALKGEVKIYHYSDYKERFEELDKVIVAPGRPTLAGQNTPGRPTLAGQNTPGRSRPTGQNAPGRSRLAGQNAPGQGPTDKRPDSAAREYKIENVRYQKDMVIVKFKGVDDRNAAEKLKDSEVFITEEDLRELPEDTFYIRDLIGCEVKDARDESLIGKITDVLQNGAQDIYQVELKDGGQALIPAVGQFVETVDVENKTVVVRPISGLIPGGR